MSTEKLIRAIRAIRGEIRKLGVRNYFLPLLLLWGTQGLKAAERRWPFTPPKAVAPPQVEQADWVRNPLDAFILARLEAKGLQPSLEASRQALMRCIYCSCPRCETGLALLCEFL